MPYSVRLDCACAVPEMAPNTANAIRVLRILPRQSQVPLAVLHFTTVCSHLEIKWLRPI
jgi:hypothetical protein